MLFKQIIIVIFKNIIDLLLYYLILFNLENFLFGVNFNGFRCATYQNRSVTPEPPNNYVDDSFRIFSEVGMNCIRIPMYWESYENNPEEFIQELDEISKAADKYNIRCIYDNHQWECSSYLGYGIGFPNSVLIQYFHKDNPEKSSLNPPTHEDLEKFWNGWWDRKLITAEGKEGWDAQLEYFETVVKRVQDKKSTLGFEILNEPQVFRQGDFKVVGDYHYYIIKKLEAITDKPFFFCFTNSASLFAINLPTEQAKTIPLSTASIKNNLILDVHPYPPSFLAMEFYKALSLLMNKIPIYIGEFNAGIKNGVTINEKQFVEYLNRLKNLSLYGCALWQWSYITDNDHPAFNITEIVDGKISPNNNFKNLVKSIKTNHN